MSDTTWTIGAVLLVAAVWTWAGWFYKRIYGRSLKWWAVPFAHGALLWGRRMPSLERRPEHCSTL